MDIKPTKIKPLFNYIYVTYDKYIPKEFDGKIITKAVGVVEEFQRVAFIGETVRTVKVGDIVKLNLRNYEVKNFKEGSIKENIQSMDKIVSYCLNIVEVDGIEYIKLSDNDIDYIVEEYEEEKPKLIQDDKELILN